MNKIRERQIKKQAINYRELTDAGGWGDGLNRCWGLRSALVKMSQR